ncbi:unnamed protein product [Ectocarpus sp. CCAP 1310/34]|nr:unnamed protein product [Ectocarpus sp. CCAP 1310/34]
MMKSSSVASLVALAGILGHTTITSTEALQVLTPAVAEVVVSGRPYIVSWNGASADDRFEIDLHYCGSYSYCFEEAECGFWLANVCAEGDGSGCMSQADQSSQVTFPEPLGGRSNEGYRIRIAEVGSDTYRCSDDFYLMSSADAPAAGEEGGPTIEVVAPTADALAIAGEIYTVEFDYDNGFGEQLGRFKIDLYKAWAEDGAGDCGTWVTSVCDKPDVGCLDSQGDYNVVIPADSEDGMYKIRVGLFGDDTIYACSPSFEVVASTTSSSGAATDAAGAAGLWVDSATSLSLPKVLLP